MANLMLVDDEPGLLEGLETHFEGKGHQLFAAGSLEQAIRLAEERRPDAVVSDLYFPGGGGLALRDELSRRNLDPGFILMTGHASLETALLAINRKVDEYLLKPLDLGELDLAVERALLRKAGKTHALKVRFEAAEAFYQDLAVPFNLLLPRLCILLEGRHGALNLSQVQNVSGQFEQLREILWVLKGFYPRVLESQADTPARRKIYPQKLVRGVLSMLESDFAGHEMDVVVSPDPELPVEVDLAKSQDLLEMVLMRALAIAPKGGRLALDWEQEERHLALTVRWVGDSGLNERRSLAKLLPLAPLSETRMEKAGLSLNSGDAAGPWVLRFALPD